MNPEEAVKENEEKLKREVLEEDKRLRQKYNVVFSSPQGKEVLEDLKDMFFFKRSTFVPSQVAEAGTTPMAYNEGQRMVIMHIEEMMRVAEEEEGES